MSQTKTRLFGTDGVRGVANQKLTCELAYQLGKAAVKFLGTKIVIGKDTRRSGDMLEAALVAGITSKGGNVFLTGVIPTPAIALITSTGDYDGGVVISASHNPPAHNGIKFFDRDGFKLPDALEDEMQAYIEAGCPDDKVAIGPEVGMSYAIPNAHQAYIQNAIKAIGPAGTTLDGMKIVVDCGFGASCTTTPQALAQLGAEVIAMNTEWTGDNINVDCGSTNLGQLKAAVIEHGACIGIAHDGDADRMLAVDENGNEIDGDQIEAICALQLKDEGLLTNDTIVSTTVCNLGLIKSMEKVGISVKTTNVGDRYVLQEMLAGNYKIGGEPSGHMIFLDYNTTGDGLVSALRLIAAMAKTGKSASELAKCIEKLPQSTVNVPVTDKEAAIASQSLSDMVENKREELGDRGRIQIRKSGTEDLIRVTVDADNEELAQKYSSEIAEFIKSM